MPNKFHNKKNSSKTSNSKVLFVLLGVCVVVLALALILPRIPEWTAPSPSSTPPSAPLPPSSAVFVPPSSLPPAVSSSLPPEPEPEPPPPPSFSFTEEETAQLNTMLQNWIDTALPPEDFELEEGTVYGKNVSLYFQDLESGTEYIFNAEAKFHIASLNKAPYSMYLYQLAEAGQCSLDEIFHVTPESLIGSEENSGFLRQDPSLPRDITMRELISYMIRYSDTAALRILLARYPAANYAPYAAGLGLHYPEDVKNLTNSRITALDTGVYLRALYNYMEQGVYGADLKEEMMNTRNLMIRSSFPVARKYGWDKEALHDMAVVYAEHPYVLAILTNKSAGTWAEQNMFAEISKTIEEMMTNKWANYVP